MCEEDGSDLTVDWKCKSFKLMGELDSLLRLKNSFGQVIELLNSMFIVPFTVHRDHKLLHDSRLQGDSDVTS